MFRFWLSPGFIGSVALSLCASAPAQDNPSLHFRNAPDAAQHDPTLPFALTRDQTMPPVSLRPAEQMSRADQDLMANAQSSIQEKAGFENLDFNEAGWAYQQIVCPTLPNHLLVRFSRDDGSRQLSMFSVAIPRGSEGKVRIIPIVRKGYSLFSPAPINALTLSAFNHIRAEEPFEKAPDWVGTGLCYAALTGGDPDFGNVEPDNKQDPEVPVAMSPTLDWQLDGRANIRFIARSANSRPMLWTMIFDRKGVLVKARHTPATFVAVKQAPKWVSEPTADEAPALKPAANQ